MLLIGTLLDTFLTRFPACWSVSVFVSIFAPDAATATDDDDNDDDDDDNDDNDVDILQRTVLYYVAFVECFQALIATAQDGGFTRDCFNLDWELAELFHLDGRWSLVLMRMINVAWHKHVADPSESLIIFF